MITRHSNSLPPHRLESVNGSKVDANCTEFFMYSHNICSGTSVLNDGITPVPDGIDTSDTWASQLFTLSGTRGIIRLSFELNTSSHDRVKLAVFNCPGMGIGLSSVRVYFDESFRPDRTWHYSYNTLGTLIMESQVMATSCDGLVEICLKYDAIQSPCNPIH